MIFYYILTTSAVAVQPQPNITIHNL